MNGRAAWRRRRAVASSVPVPRRPGRGDGWALTRVVDHVAFAGGRMTAWYLADPQTWSFRSVAEGEGLIRDQAAVLAELVGTTVYGRVTYRPYPVSHWARAHWDNAPDPQPGFDAMVQRDQVHMSSSAQADKLVYYGVDLGRARQPRRDPGQGGRRRGGPGTRSAGSPAGRCGPDHGRRRHRGPPGQSPGDMEWLLARSFALGCPVPVPDPHTDPRPVLDAEDLDEWVSTVHWDAAAARGVDEGHHERQRQAGHPARGGAVAGSDGGYRDPGGARAVDGRHRRPARSRVSGRGGSTRATPTRSARR